MSTNALIVRENADDTYDALYVHYDGYPEYLGKTLLENYNSLEHVNALMELQGSIDFLETTIEETIKNVKQLDISVRHYEALDFIQEYMISETIIRYLYIFNVENSTFDIKYGRKTRKPLKDYLETI